MKHALKLASAILVLVALSACVAGSGESQHAADGGIVSQLFLGFWHGLIAPLTLIVEVINKLFPHVLPWTVRFYEVRGTGAPYDVGFYIGLAGSPSIVWRRWSRRR